MVFGRTTGYEFRLKHLLVSPGAGSFFFSAHVLLAFTARGADVVVVVFTTSRPYQHGTLIVVLPDSSKPGTDLCGGSQATVEDILDFGQRPAIVVPSFTPFATVTNVLETRSVCWRDQRRCYSSTAMTTTQQTWPKHDRFGDKTQHACSDA